MLTVTHVHMLLFLVSLSVCWCLPDQQQHGEDSILKDESCDESVASNNLNCTEVTDVCLEERFVYLYGRSQAGKTCFANSVCSELCQQTILGAVGDGSGESVTADLNVFKLEIPGSRCTKVLYLFDTPGSGDTKLDFTEKDILESIAYAVTKASNSKNAYIDAILLAESLQDGASQIKDNLKHLKTVFGGRIDESVIVLGLRKRHAPAQRIPNIRRICDTLQLPFVVYESLARDPIDSDHHYSYDASAMSQLLDILESGRLKRFHRTNIEEHQQHLNLTAWQMMAAAPQECVNRTEPYESRELEWYTPPKDCESCWVFGTCCTHYDPIQRWTTVIRHRVVCDPIPKDIEVFRIKAMEEWEKKIKDKLRVSVTFH